ncbi:hypothetical protein Q644_07005 [Brucella intermedia 229E]|uniref:Uncharacterized protein n=1 Tax=Brucella intermedia 229E TaxID=1337887 RepID=U4V4V6_9HYPH|nr:hypothetical protein Q644_07005 [Brucella intermedia 229E]
MNVRLVLDWWPVGQGLFSSGRLHHDNQVASWVYDCGTASSDRHLLGSLYDFGREHTAAGADGIDFAVLSHFDRDHVSGFERLVVRHPIHMVLLPYIPLWQRLVIAAQQGIAAEDALFRFFVNPAGYLFSIPGQQIGGEVVFVPPAGSGGGEGGDGEFPSAPAPEGPRPSELKVDYGAPPDDERPILAAHIFHDPPRVRYLAKGGRLLLPFWEFVPPYNDAELSVRADAAFRAAAEPLIQRLIRPSRGSPAVALKKLRSLYDRTFGKTSSRRNQISLFLYSGPLDHCSCADVMGGSPPVRARRLGAFCAAQSGRWHARYS